MLVLLIAAYKVMDKELKEKTHVSSSVKCIEQAHIFVKSNGLINF